MLAIVAFATNAIVGNVAGAWFPVSEDNFLCRNLARILAGTMEFDQRSRSYWQGRSATNKSLRRGRLLYTSLRWSTMAIKFFCACGKKLKAAGTLAGRKAQCTACGRVIVIPGLSTEPSAAPGEPIAAPWYFSQHGQVLGPLSEDDLKTVVKAGRLAADDQVLPPGAEQWILARAVPGLFSAGGCVPAVDDLDEPAILGIEFESRREVLAEAQVVPDASRCVQCGICSHNCPMGIDVRAHAWRGRTIHDSRCLTCSECVQRCPRGVLRFERLSLFHVET